MKKQTINEVMGLKAEKRKKNKRRLKRILAILKLIVILALAIAAIVFTALSPLFNINTVEVKGAIYYNKEAMIGISGIRTGVNGFKEIGSSPLNVLTFRFGEAENIIKRNCPYIKEVKVKFAVPSTVVIDLKERSAFFTISYQGTSFLIDREGYVLEVLPQGSKSRYPTLEGLKFKDYKLGEKLEIEKADVLNNGIKLFETINENDRINNINMVKHVNAIDAGDAANIKFSLDSRITVKIGDFTDLNYRISVVKTFYNENIKKSEKGVLDFTSGKNPVFSPDDGG